MLDQETNYYSSYINLYFIWKGLLDIHIIINMFPLLFSVSYICAACVFSQKPSDSTDRKHHFCVNIQHQCKATICSLSFSITACENLDFPVSLRSFLISFISVLVQQKRAERRLWSEQILLENGSSHSHPGCPHARLLAFHRSAPFVQMMLRRCGVLDYSHTVRMRCISTSGENSLMSCRTSQAVAWRKKIQTRYGDLVSDMKSWRLFVFLHCSSCCVYPWVCFSVTIPISQIGQFQFVFGAWIASVCHSVLGLSMDALWGGGDDACGPVLFQVMTDSFRRSQSPPLGGAIPSAVSPEEADTLEHRDSSGEKSEWCFLFYTSCDFWRHKQSTTQASHVLPHGLNSLNFPLRCVCLTEMALIASLMSKHVTTYSHRYLMAMEENELSSKIVKYISWNKLQYFLFCRILLTLFNNCSWSWMEEIIKQCRRILMQPL